MINNSNNTSSITKQSIPDGSQVFFPVIDLKNVIEHQSSNLIQNSETDDKLYLSALNSKCKVVLEKLSIDDIKRTIPTYLVGDFDTTTRGIFHHTSTRISKLNNLNQSNSFRFLNFPRRKKLPNSDELNKKNRTISLLSDSTDSEDNPLYIDTDYIESKKIPNNGSQKTITSSAISSKSIFKQKLKHSSKILKRKHDSNHKNEVFIEKNLKETPLTYEQLFKKNFSVLGSGLKIAKKTILLEENNTEKVTSIDKYSSTDKNTGSEQIKTQSNVINDKSTKNNHSNYDCHKNLPKGDSFEKSMKNDSTHLSRIEEAKRINDINASLKSGGQLKLENCSKIETISEKNDINASPKVNGSPRSKNCSRIEEGNRMNDINSSVKESERHKLENCFRTKEANQNEDDSSKVNRVSKLVNSSRIEESNRISDINASLKANGRLISESSKIEEANRINDINASLKDNRQSRLNNHYKIEKASRITDNCLKSSEQPRSENCSRIDEVNLINDNILKNANEQSKIGMNWGLREKFYEEEEAFRDSKYCDYNTNSNKTEFNRLQVEKMVYQDPWKKYFAKNTFSTKENDKAEFRKRKYNDVIEIEDSDDSDSIEVIVKDESFVSPIKSWNRNNWILNNSNFKDAIDDSIVKDYYRDSKWLNLRNRDFSKYYNGSKSDFCEIISQKEKIDNNDHGIEIDLSSPSFAKEENGIDDSNFNVADNYRSPDMWMDSLNYQNNRSFRNRFHYPYSHTYVPPYENYIEGSSKTEYLEPNLRRPCFKNTTKPKFVLPFQYKYVNYDVNDVCHSSPLNSLDDSIQYCDDEGLIENERHCRGCQCHQSIGHNRHAKEMDFFHHKMRHSDPFSTRTNRFFKSSYYSNSRNDSNMTFPVLCDPFDDEQKRVEHDNYNSEDLESESQIRNSFKQKKSDVRYDQMFTYYNPFHDINRNQMDSFSKIKSPSYTPDSPNEKEN